MTKTAIKSALIALVSLIAVVFLTVGIISIVSPKTMALFCDGAGLKNASVYYYKADYNRDADFYKLAALIDAADYADDDKTLAVYGEKFVLSSEFASYCVKKDETADGNKISSYDYYCYLAVTSLYETGAYDKSVALAYGKTETYSEKCPLKVAVMTAKTNKNRTYAEAIITAYKNGEKSRISDGDGVLRKDIEELKEKYKERMA